MVTAMTAVTAFSLTYLAGMSALNAIVRLTERRDPSPMATRRSGCTPSASASSSRSRCKSRAYLGNEAQKTLAAEAAGPAGRHDVVAWRAVDDRCCREFGKARHGQP